MSRSEVLCVCVLVRWDHKALGLGSKKRWCRLEVCLSTKTTCRARARCPFVQPNAFVDCDLSSVWARGGLELVELWGWSCFETRRGSALIEFSAHRTSERRGTQGKHTKNIRTHIHECTYTFMRMRGAWARPKRSLVTRRPNTQGRRQEHTNESRRRGAWARPKRSLVTRRPNARKETRTQTRKSEGLEEERCFNTPELLPCHKGREHEHEHESPNALRRRGASARPNCSLITRRSNAQGKGT